MEFLRERVYTSLNADELKAGDKVIVANTLKDLKSAVDTALYVYELTDILTESSEDRFFANDRCYLLAYLVEIRENCTNCGCVHCWYREKHGIDEQRLHTCSRRIEPKTEQKAEKHYRPFRDTDELIKVWDAKYRYAYGLERINNGLDMPHIWVRQKECSKGGLLITYFGEDEVKTDMGFMTMNKLLSDYTFTDGSPCGVEE